MNPWWLLLIVPGTALAALTVGFFVVRKMLGKAYE